MLCFASRPLTVDELLHAHAVDLCEPPHLDLDGRMLQVNDIYEMCLGLVEIRSEEGHIEGSEVFYARLSHFSVKEYLESERIQNQRAARFALKGGVAQSELTQICLVYLLDPEVALRVWGTVDSESRLFASFAATEWPLHYSSSLSEKPKLDNLVREFFRGEASLLIQWRSHQSESFSKSGGIFNTTHRLHCASMVGIDWLVQEIIAPQSKSPDLIRDIVNNTGDPYANPLQAALANGHTEVAQILLNYGADVNMRTKDWFGEFSMLGDACAEGRTSLVQWLLDYGADVNMGRTLGVHKITPLATACSHGHTNVVKLLLKYGADTSGEVINEAAYQGHENVVQALLDHVDDSRIKRDYFSTAIQAAASKGHENMLEMLLNRYQGIDISDKDYDAAIRAAESGKHGKALQVLLDRGLRVLGNLRWQLLGQMHLEAKACKICGKTVEIKICSQCKAVAYCGIEHQRKDWKTHKKSCMPRIRQDR